MREDRRGGKERAPPSRVAGIQAEAGTRAWLVKAKPGEGGSGGYPGDGSEMRIGRKQECGQIARGLGGQSGTCVPRGQDAAEEFQTSYDLPLLKLPQSDPG